MKPGTAKLILRLGGWKTEGKVPKENKVLVTAAPHTSKIDIFWAWIFYTSLGGRFNFVIRENLDNWFFRLFLTRIGGMRVPKKSADHLARSIIDLYNSNPNIHMAISPEGTTKRNPVWSAAFHLIASSTGAMVYTAYLDYEKKIIGISDKPFPLSATARESVKEMYRFYKDFKGRKPERFAVGNF